jgi:hypothetical protein
MADNGVEMEDAPLHGPASLHGPAKKLHRTRKNYPVYNRFLLLALAHAVVGVVTWALLIGHRPMDFFLYTPVRFFVGGAEKHTMSGPLGLLGMLGIVFGYLGCVLATLQLTGLIQWTIGRLLAGGDMMDGTSAKHMTGFFFLFGLGNVGLFLSLAPVMGQQDLYEILAGALAILAAAMAQGMLCGALEGDNTGNNIGKSVPVGMAWLAGLAACAPYVIGIFNVGFHGAVHLSGSPAGKLYQTAFWIGAVGKILLEMIVLYTICKGGFVMDGPKGAQEPTSDERGKYRAYKFKMFVLFSAGFVTFLVLFFTAHSDWQVYTPVFWTIGATHEDSWAFPAAALLIPAWGIYPLADLVSLAVLNYRSASRDTYWLSMGTHGTDHSFACAFSIMTGCLLFCSGLISGVQGVMELVELAAFGVAGTLLSHFAVHPFFLVVAALMTLGPWAMVLGKLLVGDDELGALTQVITLGVLYLLYVVADFILRRNSAKGNAAAGRSAMNRTTFYYVAALGMLVSASTMTLQMVTRAEAQAVADNF